MDEKRCLCLVPFARLLFLRLWLCTNDLTLAILRAFQGVGDAATIPSALGILAYVLLSAGAFDMIISGVLTQLSSHTDRIGALYFIWLPLIGVSGLISFDADIPSLELVKHVDLMGTSLVTVGLVLIVFVLGQGEIASDGWKPPYIIALLIVGVIMLALFLVWEWKLERIIDEDLSKVASMWTPPPLMRLLLWTQAKGRMAVILVIALLNFIGWSFWVQLFYQNYLLLTPGQNHDSHVYCRLFMQLFYTDGRCKIALGYLCSQWDVLEGRHPIYPNRLVCNILGPRFPVHGFSPCSALTCASSNTNFIAQTSLPHEHNVAGALFQTMTQIGTASSLAIYNCVQHCS
ncbi:hypothetical protein F4604DRAFT_901651 [Suillus subluteus]|nr:hypothetical protein F4604DRAFT_901651 [Suillus subluteus]